MPLWLAITLPIVLAVSVVIANKKIRFAPNEDVANSELKLLALRVGQWVINLGVIGFYGYYIFSTITSSEPLTRAAVFAITTGVAGLMFQIVMFFIAWERKTRYDQINQLYDQINRLYGELGKVYQHINRLNDNIDTVGEAVGTVSESVILVRQLSELRLKAYEHKSSLLDSAQDA